jgi:hypothetical protein
MNSQVLVLVRYSTVALGVVLGAFGLVREGAILIAVGTAAVALSRHRERPMERYLPLALSLALLILAIVIPAGR